MRLGVLEVASSARRCIASKETGEFALDFSCTRFLQRDIARETPIVEIDLFANIHRINGEDAWPS